MNKAEKNRKLAVIARLNKAIADMRARRASYPANTTAGQKKITSVNHAIRAAVTTIATIREELEVIRKTAVINYLNSQVNVMRLRREAYGNTKVGMRKTRVINEAIGRVVHTIADLRKELRYLSF